MESFNSTDKFNQDPDYFVPLENNINHQSICEENALSTAKKISKILETEFSKEIDAKKKEVIKIYETLNKACRIFHYLRYAIVTDYYNQDNAYTEVPLSLKQARLHPTVNAPTTNISYAVDCENDCFIQRTNEINNSKRKIESESSGLDEYNEPKPKMLKKDLESPYLSRRKIKIRVIVGNYSKWIPPDCRENNDATHKWTVYVIDSQKSDLGNFVSKVRFFLHPSYQPNDVVELMSSPFHLSRLGWGEFPIRVQLHFKNNINKPVDIIHNLKLDRTYTGILTIGSETVVDIWLIVNDKILPYADVTTEGNDVSSEDKTNTSNISLSVNKEVVEDIPVTIKEEKHADDISKQDDHENSKDSIMILSDHDYIRTNFAPIKSGNNKQASENSLSILKSNNSKSLLKSNYANNTCTIVIDKGKIISSNQNHNFDELPVSDKLESKPMNSKQNFDSEKHYTNSDNAAQNRKNVKKLMSLIEQAKPTNLFSVLKLVARGIPLITEDAKNEQYKSLYPYACESYQVFSNYSQGKQHATERYRALHALDIMRDIQCFESSCSVKEFMTWARRYGYTPLLNLKTLRKLSSIRKKINIEEMSKNYDNTATISMDLNHWLLQCQNIKPCIKQISHDSDDDIDIINTESSAPKTKSNHENSNANTANVILLDHSKNYKNLNEFVCKTAEKIGIKLHSSASLVITEALGCLVDELTRSALSCAIDKCSMKKNVVDFEVEVDDVHKALLKREEFDLFTNAGLGSEG